MSAVTIVIPILNRSQFLPELFRSIASVNYEELEIILVDNGSSDGSLAMCRTFAEDAPMVVQVLEEPRRGACCARNRGLHECRTPWVYFFDSDDLLTPTFLTTLMPLVGDVDLVAFPTCQRVGDCVRQRSFVASASPASQLLSSTLNTAGMLFRTQFLQRIGGWNEELDIWQDWELGIRALLARPRIHWERQPFHEILIHPRSITGGSYAQRREEIHRTLEVVAGEVGSPSLCRALALRGYIVNGQLRRQGSHSIPLPVYASVPTRVLGFLLSFYTQLGGRGAWRIARLFC